MTELPAIPLCNVSDIVRYPLLHGWKAASSIDAYTSLPPLPQQLCPKPDRCRRWGEDAVLERAGFDVTTSGYARFRNHFYCSHPLQEHDDAKSPKLRLTGQSVYRNPTDSSTAKRRVHRNPTYEVFPTHNTQRTNEGGHHVLTSNTMGSITNGVQKLYCNSRYDDIFRDRTDFMVAKQQRDTAYNDACAEFDEAPTCTRILNHPDPCSWCWAGGLNKDFQNKLDKFQSKLADITKRDPAACRGYPDVPCNRCKGLQCPHKDHCIIPEVKKVKAGHSDRAFESRDVQSNNWLKTKEQEEVNGSNWRSADDYMASYDIRPETLGVHSNDFGPWTDNHRLGVAEEPYLVQDVYNFRFPSALHCSKTENALDAPFIERHNPEYYSQVPVGSPQYLNPWVSMCRTETQFPSVSTGTSAVRKIQGHLQEEYTKPEIASSNQRNTWTFRDENNLRIPCVSSVLGCLSKTDAQKRFQREHRDAIPDLRDNKRDSRRVNFFGYNSSVFR